MRQRSALLLGHVELWVGRPLPSRSAGRRLKKTLLCLPCNSISLLSVSIVRLMMMTRHFFFSTLHRFTGVMVVMCRVRNTQNCDIFNSSKSNNYSLVHCRRKGSILGVWVWYFAKRQKRNCLALICCVIGKHVSSILREKFKELSHMTFC